MCEVHYSNLTYPHDGFHPYFYDTISTTTIGSAFINQAQRIANVLHQATINTVLPFQALDNQAMWYLSPLQQVIESLALLLFLIPFTYALYTKNWKLDIPALPPRTNFAYGQYTLNNLVDYTIYPALYYGGPLLQVAEILLTLAAWILLPLTIYYKIVGEMNRIAYLLQPCHLQNGLLCLLSLSNRSSWSRIIYYFYLCTLYGPILALVTPDTKGLDMFGEVTAFYIQHYMLVLLPLIWLVRRRYPLYTGFRLTLWTWAAFFIVHLTIFLPASFISGRNVNYMMVPPTALEFAGPYYRIVMGIGCIALGFIARHIIVEGTVYLSGIRDYYIYEKEELEYFGYNLEEFYNTGLLVPIEDFSTIATSPLSVKNSKTPHKDSASPAVTTIVSPVVPSTQKRGRAGSVSASVSSSSKSSKFSGTPIQISEEPTVGPITSPVASTSKSASPHPRPARIHTVPAPTYIASPLSGILDNFWASPLATVQEATTYLLPMSPRILNNSPAVGSAKKIDDITASSSSNKRSVSQSRTTTSTASPNISSPTTNNIPTPPTMKTKDFDFTVIGSPAPIVRPGMVPLSNRKVGPVTRDTAASAAKKRGTNNTLMSPTMNSTRMRTIFSPK